MIVFTIHLRDRFTWTIKNSASTRLNRSSKTLDLRPQGLITLLIPTHVSIIISDILPKSYLLSR